MNDLVYVDNSSAPNRLQGLTSAEEDQSVKLRTKRSGPYRVVQATPHTVTFDIYGLHIFVAIDRVTLSMAAQEFNQDASQRNCDNQFSLEHGTTHTKLHTQESVMEKKANTAPEKDVLSPTAQENAVRTELREQFTANDEEEKDLPMENVIDRVIDSSVDGQRTLYRARR